MVQGLYHCDETYVDQRPYVASNFSFTEAFIHTDVSVGVIEHFDRIVIE